MKTSWIIDHCPLDAVLAGKSPVEITGLSGGSKAFFLLAYALKTKKPVVAVSVDDAEAEGLLTDLEGWANLLPAPERPGLFLFPDPDAAVRLATLGAWREQPWAIVLTSKSAIEKPTLSAQQLGGEILELRPGKTYPRSELLETFARGGYDRTDMVELEGEVAVRGEVVDVWAPGAEKPWRLLFDGDELESLRAFTPGTQRSEGYLNPQKLLPMKEAKAEGHFADHVPNGTVWFWDDIEPHAVIPDVFKTLLYRGLPSSSAIDLGFKSTTGLASGIAMAAQEAKRRKQEGGTVLFFSHNAGENERLAELMDEQLGSEDTEGFEFVLGPLRAGFFREKLLVLSNAEIFGRYRQRSRLPKFKGGQALREARDLKSGDYVVHEYYGIGRYKGLELLNAGGQEAEFLRLEYKHGDRLFVPLADFKQVQKYSGSEGKSPRLNSLDASAWERVKQRVKEGIELIAKDLLRVHATRAALPGHSFPEDSHLEEEFSASFLYEETPDQIRAIQDVKRDMESSKPMDRLIFGDVGYGKTEVAMRAAFKAVVDSKQVAVLVPTTILAEQHYRTFKERFADYPARIGFLSRFQSEKEEKEVLVGVANGTIDIVIGTHRLLQKDVVFKEMGLLIIDEEHRFGVKHKEQLKKMRQHMDVLTMTATPIPRTLSFAMAGLRDMSVIETAPAGRLPITTHVGPYDDAMIKQAIQTELDRGGQVFYVHNRVQSLPTRLHFLKQLMPELSIGVVHGQMSGPAIEKVMWEFLHRKHQVLLATTIIESGIDIPTVNTLIVDEAEEFGMAQLYQLRGRVGRDRAKAYCYLFYSPSVPLSGDARERLEALREFTELGSGYRLAMRDMEIRGTGNLLGQEQSGFVAAVGLDLYTQLLQEEIARLKGETVKETPRFPTMDLSLRAYLPPDYMPSEELRILFYKKLVSAQSLKEIEAIRGELEDRFGPLPADADMLFDVSQLRIRARDLGIAGVIQKPSSLEIEFLANTPVQPQTLVQLCQERSALRLKPGKSTILQIQSIGYEANGPLPYLVDLWSNLI